MDLRSQLPNERTPVQPSGGSPIALDPPSPSSILGDPPIDPPTDPWNAGALCYQDPELILPRLAQEGGAPLISFLLAKAIPSDNEEGKTLPPTTSEVRSWQYQDILQLPKVQKEEWKKACHEELESLREHRVFELTDLPYGRKVIKNCWVFDIKSDGRKKA